MSILTRFRDWRRKRYLKYLNSTGTGMTVRPKNTWIPHWLRGDYTLKNSELIFAAVTRISNSLSAMPIQLYQGAKPLYNELNDRISFSPNPLMTSAQFFKTMEACRCTAGNCFALKIYRPGEVIPQLNLLDPTRVFPIIEKNSGELWWRVQPDEGPEMYVHDYYMVHVPFISTNGVGGISPVSVLFDTLKYAENIQEFNVKQLEQGVNSAIVLEAPANLGTDQKKAMVEDFMNTYRETSGNILLLESGVTAKTLNLSPVDSMLFEVEKITRSKVAMVYNIPPHLLGDYSDSGFSSQEQMMLEFLTLTMLPIVTAYEQELNRKLLTADQRRSGLRFKFDMDALLRADAATQAEVDYKAVRSGWKTVDEIRNSRNMPALPKGIGKYALVSQDLATLDYTVNDKPKVLMRGVNEGASGGQSQTQTQTQTESAPAE
ncbi:MAG: phage portal protein [Oscillospiraceae bacterium]|nr:phage portal protein [Oscillospiraceae bacterium]